MRRRTAAPSTLERSASLGVPTSLPPRAVLQRGSSVGTTTIASQGTPRTHKSKFKRAYKKIMVPPVLEQGVPVTVSFEDDRRPKKHYMTLSRDKFTLYISPKPLDEDFFKEKKDGIRHASWLSKLRRSSSLDSASSSAEGEIQAIGIGAIHRIQRGAHNANLKTTTNSVAKVQNLKRRSSAESAKWVTKNDIKEHTHASITRRNGAKTQKLFEEQETCFNRNFHWTKLHLIRYCAQ